MADGNDPLGHGGHDGRLGHEARCKGADDRTDPVTEEVLVKFSHDLRGRLSAITGWAEVLESHVTGDEFAERALATIKRNAEAQARLIRDLLDYLLESRRAGSPATGRRRGGVPEDASRGR